MDYRTASLEDTKTVHEIVQHTVKSIYPNYYPAEVVGFFCNLHSKDAIKEDIEKKNVSVLAVDNKIVGTGSFLGNHITRVYVLPEYQGRGYGTLIVNRIEAEIAKKYEKAYLDASLPAVRLYEKLGYKSVKHERHPVSHNVALVYEVMVKQLNAVQDPIYARRSTRKFQDRAVEPETVEAILDAGRVAPSAKNRQPWRFQVYSGEAKQALLERMRQGIEREGEKASLPLSVDGLPDAKNTLHIMENAPVVIMVLNTNGKSPFCALNADERFTEMNDMLSIGAAVENMLLKAEELNIGTLWIGNTCFAYKELTAYMGTDVQLTGAVALGYKAEYPHMRPRKGLADIVKYFS